MLPKKGLPLATSKFKETKPVGALPDVPVAALIPLIHKAKSFCLYFTAILLIDSTANGSTTLKTKEPEENILI